MATVVDAKKCIGCGSCQAVCPADPNCYEVAGGKSKVVHPEACIECGACVRACPVSAITLKNKKK